MASERLDQKQAATSMASTDLFLLADPTTGEMSKITKEAARGHKVYSFNIFQGSGDTNPVIRVLENTIGAIEWTYDSVFEGSLAGAFPTGRTFLTPTYETNPPTSALFYTVEGNEDDVYLLGFDNGVPSNQIFSNYPLSYEIRVYPAVIQTIEFV